MKPPPGMFTTREWRLIERLDTPLKVQRWLNRLPYNTEKGGGTQRSFRGVIRKNMAHCMEAALFTAVVLEQHGYPPIVMSLESKDWLDHVIFIYKRNGDGARSRAHAIPGCTAARRHFDLRGRSP